MKSKRSRLPLFMLVVGLVVFSHQVFGQSGPSSVTGYVLTPEGRPVAQVWVELKNDVNRIIGRLRTDSSGRYYFRNLINGRYSIRVLPLGTAFLEQVEEIELAGLGSRGQQLSDNQQKDIYLRLRKPTDPVAGSNEVLFAQPAPKEAEDLYKNAISDLDRQRVKDGIEGLEKAIAIFPTYFLALQKLGAIRLVQGEFENAIKLLDAALAVNSRCYDCWYGIGYASYMTGNYPQAVAAVEKALLERPESEEANLLMGMSCRMIKDLARAEKALKLVVKVSNGSSADAHWQLALLYGRDTNRFAEAARELESYLKVFPEAPNKESIKKLIKQFKDRSKA